MGMALLRLRKGKGRKGAGPAVPGNDPAEPALPMLPPPVAHRSARPKVSGAPVVHIHIGPNSAHPDQETPEEDAGESPETEAAEDMPPPALLQALHDKIQKARAAGKR